MLHISISEFLINIQGRLPDVGAPRRPRQPGRPRGRRAGRHPQEAGTDAALRRLLAGEQTKGKIIHTSISSSLDHSDLLDSNCNLTINPLPKVTEANPDMPFPDVGRMLGEMWHNLTHEEKEEYRDGSVSPFGQPLSGFWLFHFG